MMNSFMQLFQKAGGVNLIKEYARSGVLCYAIFQTLIIGFSKKSLEIVRLGVQLKINNKLKKKYIHTLEAFDNVYSTNTLRQDKSQKVWVCWMQGIDNAPILVQYCYEQLKRHLKNREIILITKENIKQYVSFPPYIEDKYARGIITHTHFSDILRIELLCKYGGTWIDSTVLCTGSNIPSYMLNSNLFLFQNLKPGYDGSILNISSWFITACNNHKILLAVKEMLYAYWKENNYMIDYFLLHHFFSIASKYYINEWKQIMQYPNSLPHVLLLNIFEPFDQEKFNELTQICPFHKLAYKRSITEVSQKDTYYDFILNNLHP